MSLDTAKTISVVTFLFAAEAALITSGWLFSTQSASAREFWFCLSGLLDSRLLSVVGVLLFLLDPVPVDDDDAVRFLVDPKTLK